MCDRTGNRGFDWYWFDCTTVGPGPEGQRGVFRRGGSRAREAKGVDSEGPRASDPEDWIQEQGLQQLNIPLSLTLESCSSGTKSGSAPTSRVKTDLRNLMVAKTAQDNECEA